ncbi:MAG TPA: hypothetical protein VKA30_04945, partial [Actinomycetota bacterium]|nr:hypothetical protein [Actinomycetota bacterium]
ALVLSGTPVAVGEGSAWVVDHARLSLLRIDPRTNRVIARISLSAVPDGVAVGDGLVWVRHNGVVASVTRVDPGTNRAAGTIQLPAGADGMAVGGGSVWVTDTTNDTLIKLDPATMSTSDTIDVGRSPQAVAVDDAGDVWVYNTGDSTVSKVDGGTGTVVVVIEIPRRAPDETSAPRRGLAVGFGSLWVT